MKNSKKILILFITLSFPVILYLFLMEFGKNEYDLPVFFADNQLPDSCENRALQLLQSDLNLSEQLDFHLIIFPDANRDNQPIINELNRLSQEFNDFKFDILTIYDSVAQDDFSDKSLHEVKNIVVSPVKYKILTNCTFILPTTAYVGNHPAELSIDRSSTIILLDSNLKIRGYYDGFETKEVDRLILELKILLDL